jgi:hypothetical protein
MAEGKFNILKGEWKVLSMKPSAQLDPFHLLSDDFDCMTEGHSSFFFSSCVGNAG